MIREFISQLKKPIQFYFRYFYNHKSSNDPWPSWSGSKHGDEVEMVFGSPLQNPKKYKSEEVKFSKDIIKYWTNFVRTGYVTKVFNGWWLNSYFLSTYYMKISETLVDF